MKVMQQNILEEKDKLFVSWIDIENLVQELWKKIVIGSIPFIFAMVVKVTFFSILGVWILILFLLIS